jgi:SEC-C motif
METLLAVAPPDRTIRSVVRRLANAASDRWARLPRTIALKDRGVAFLFGGYEYDSKGPKPYWCLVSNFVDGGRSSKADFAVAEGPDTTAYMFAAGACRSPDQREMKDLRTLVEERRPAKAVVGKTVEIIQRAAEAPAAAQTVGKQCTSIIVPAQPDAPVEQAYHTAVTTNVIHGVNQIDVREGSGILVMNPSLTQDRSPSAPGNEPAIAVPKLGRNHPCPCGSRKKYKRCHGSVP